MKKLLTSALTRTSKKIFVAAIMAAIALGNAGAAQTAPPKRDFRSVWLTTYVNIDWPHSTAAIGTSASAQAAAKKELIAYLDSHEARNYTGICFHVRSMADAMYKSNYEPWSQYISGKRGTDPGWDPLAFAVEECHKRGLECYAWVNPYRVNRNNGSRTTPQDQQWKSKGWLLNNGTTTKDNEYVVFNPALDEVRQHILNVCRDIYTRYRVDGMLFDDYFYPNGIPVDQTAQDWKNFQEQNPGVAYDKTKFLNWRRENVNKLMRELYTAINAERPDMRFGLSPAGIARKGAAAYKLADCGVGTDWQYDDICSDPVAWLGQGSIDFISPQIYWFYYSTSNSYTTAAPYATLAKWWTETAEHFGRHCYVSIAPYRFLDADNKPVYNNEAHWKDLSKQIELNRSYTKNNASGAIAFSGKYLDGPACSGWGDYLQANSYQYKSLVPVVTWKEAPALAKPKATLSGSKITWTAPAQAGCDPIMRYTVYAVPADVSPSLAENADGDGISNRYLQTVVYGNSYTIPEELSGRYWYAVCAYDGYGNESEPCVLNYGATPVTVARDQTEYPATGDGQTITNLWMRSIVAPFENIDFESNGGLNRGIAIAGDKLYMSERSEAGANATSYLRCYDLNTGEYVRKIELPDIPKGITSTYPCNDIITDNQGNLYITNLTLNGAAAALSIYRFNPTTNGTTLVAECTTTGLSRPRIDHASVYVDANGTTYVFAAVSATKTICRWKVEGTTGTDFKSVDVKAFVPASASHFGTAARIFALSADRVIVDGGNTYPTEYNFNTGEIVGQPGGTAKPAGTDANGFAHFGPDECFAVYPSGTHSTTPAGHNFKISHASKHNLAELAELWTVPAVNVGAVNSTTISSPVATSTIVDGDHWSSYVAVYATGNAVGVYKVTGKTPTGIAAATAEAPTYTVVGRYVRFAAPVAQAYIYNVQGMAVTTATDATAIELPAAPGVYILRYTGAPAARILVK